MTNMLTLDLFKIAIPAIIHLSASITLIITAGKESNPLHCLHHLPTWHAHKGNKNASMSPKLKKSLTPCLTELKSLAQAEHTNTRIVRDAVDGIAQIHDNEDVEYVYLPVLKGKRMCYYRKSC